MKVKDKVIVVTGGGNGIGRQLVLELLRRGARVAAVDINEQALQQTYLLTEVKDRLSLHKLDLANKEEVDALPQMVIEKHHQIDGLINNAGIIQPFIHVKDLMFQKIYQVMNVNFYGPLFMIKALLPYLLERPEAHITNVSSMGAFVPVPGQTIYGASKAALKLLSEGLKAELKDTHVGITTVFPGGVATDITKNSGAEGTMKVKRDLSKMKMKLLSPERAAEIIIDATEKNKIRVCAGKDCKFMDWFSRQFPLKAAKVIADMLS
jgi:short-subunit dehydrogenase